MSEPEEWELARRAQSGDQNALSLLAEQLRPILFAAAFGQTRHYEDAQDVVASALLRVCRHIGKLRDPARVRVWARQIARNEARRLQATQFQTAPTPEQENTPVSPVSLTRLDIERALRLLPQQQAEAATLFYLHGVSVAAIAARLERPEGTIKYWLHQSRVRLAASLKGYAPMNPVNSPLSVAIWSSELAPALVAQMTEALKAAGWSTVRFVRDFAALAENRPDQTPPMALVNPVPDCRCHVFDETVDGHSAFEIVRLLRATPEGKNALLFLLANNNGAETFMLTALAAYMDGFDFLLTKPFDIVEFGNFAKRLYDHALREHGEQDNPK